MAGRSTMIPRFHPIFASSPSKITSVIGVLHAPQVISGYFWHFPNPQEFPKGTPLGLFLKIWESPPWLSQDPAVQGAARTTPSSLRRPFSWTWQGGRTRRPPRCHGGVGSRDVGERIGWITPSKNVILNDFDSF